MAENTSSTAIAPPPPHVDPPTPPAGPTGHNATPPAPILAGNPGLPAVLGGPTVDPRPSNEALGKPAAPRTAPAEPLGPRVIPLQEGDPIPIRPKDVMDGVWHHNDRVAVGSTPLTPDHANPLATDREKRAAELAAHEAAEQGDLRRHQEERRAELAEDEERRARLADAARGSNAR